jgi:hypothetical protein
VAKKELRQVRVDPERLEAWNTFHTESIEFDDCSDPVRKSVERIISTDTDEQDTQDAIGRQKAPEKFERIEGMVLAHIPLDRPNLSADALSLGNHASK